MESRKNPVLDFLLLLLGRKRLVLGIVLLTSSITAVYSLVMDKTFDSTALILPPEGGSSPLLGMLGDLPMGDMLGSLGGLGGGAGGEYFTAILNSRTMLEGLLETFDLRAHYEMEDDEIEKILKVMRDAIYAELEFETGMIRLTVEDKDPVTARDMAQWMIQRLEETNHDFNTRRARNSRLFVGGEVAKARAELDSLETDLVGFQQRERMLEPTEQASVIIARYSELKAQEAVKELELRMARTRLGASHPEIARLEGELAAVRGQLKQSYERGDSDLFLAVADLPETTLEFLRRKRELEIANQKLLFLLPQLEKAKIDEVNDTPVLEVIDPPRVAEKRIRPKRALMVLAAGAVSLLVASLLALFLERLERNPELAGQWASVRGHLGRLRRFKLD